MVLLDPQASSPLPFTSTSFQNVVLEFPLAKCTARLNFHKTLRDEYDTDPPPSP
jgi:hypothetical protein